MVFSNPHLKYIVLGSQPKKKKYMLNNTLQTAPGFIKLPKPCHQDHQNSSSVKKS